MNDGRPCTGTPYCTGHDATGECVIAEHVVWCTSSDPKDHDQYGDCQKVWRNGDPDGKSGDGFSETIVTGTLDGATYLEIQCHLWTLEDFDKLIADLAQARSVMATDINYRIAHGWW